MRNLVLKLKLMKAKQTKTSPFLMKDLEIVLNSLKTQKARGPEGLSRTIFKNSVIGTNLKESILIMFNKLKCAGQIPIFMRMATVTTIPKKGSKLKLENERGIFLVNTVRSILMRLLFNLKYPVFESNMSDSNVGGRKKKSGINHIWVVNNVIHDHMSSVKRIPVVIQKFDYKQMFDGMDSREACGDIFEYGIQDDHLQLIHEANKEVVICVKTPHGQSDQYQLTGRTMQGDTWAPAMASAQVDRFGKEMMVEEPSYMYKFKGQVPIPLLGQVDDLLGISEAGYKSEQLNAFVNVKTSDKDLQFSSDKCSFMVVSKMKLKSFQKSELFVDKWTLEHLEDGTIKEEFFGKVPMKEEESFVYLGHVLSKDGKNMPNIIHKQHKVIGTQKQIAKLVEPLSLYTFESTVIYVESLIRSSILYSSEAMINIKESEYRALEQIEESVLQKILNTSRSCSRHLLYLELGMMPARFQVQRQVLNLLQYIVQQPEDSLLYKVFKALENSPTQNDWLSGAKEMLKAFKINMNMKEIQSMKSTVFKNIVKKQANNAAFRYLREKQENGSKGKAIQYEQIKMADYLLPECSLSVSDKTEMFAFRCQMNDLPNNFGKEELCEFDCKELMNNEHLLSCVHLNKGQLHDLQLEQIRNGNLFEKVKVLKKLQENKERRTQYLELKTIIQGL